VVVTAARIHVEMSDSASNYTYGMYFTTAACRFWNDSTDSWDTAGCKVPPPRLLLFLSISVFLFFFSFSVLHFLVVGSVR